uniref:Uncharacterized protein n=1 Tax=Ascaris lumbricoides TaxID=6252 RepID=A0A0M3IW56_ASCLU
MVNSNFVISIQMGNVQESIIKVVSMEPIMMTLPMNHYT